MYSFNVDANRNLAILVFSGQVSVTEIREALVKLRQEPGFHPNIDLIFDAVNVDASSITGESVRWLETTPVTTLGRTVIIAPDALAFGLARMFQLLRGDKSDINVVTSREEAERFLAIPRRTTLPQ